jgi:hypothetical protein
LDVVLVVFGSRVSRGSELEVKKVRTEEKEKESQGLKGQFKSKKRSTE